MGIDYSVYVGPFLRCKYRSSTHDEELRGCPNKSCERYELFSYAKFCPECGTAIVKIVKPVPSAPDFSEVVGDDTFAELHSEGENDNNEHWLAPNRKVKGIDRDLSLDSRTDLGEAFADDEDNIANEKLSFVAQYRGDIEKLRKAYESVEIVWGVVLSAS